jgi:uncharacterized protein (DUF1499 family)
MLLRIVGVVILILVAASFILAVFSLKAKKPDDLGVKDGKLLPCSDASNCVCSTDNDELHQIEPLTFTGDPKDAMARLRAVLANQSRTRIVKEDPDYLQVECTSLVFRYVDDVEFYQDRKEKKIHVRSSSRAGKYDFGVNRRRVEAIRKAFDAQP